MANTGPVLGTTLYSFTNDWQQRIFNFDQLVAKVAELGLGPAVEVVGFQSFREYPDVSDEFARHFRDLFDKYGLTPSCLGANVDIGRRRDRRMTEEELMNYIQRQIVTAQKLGFPVMRIQGFVGPVIFEKIAPLAEKAKVHVACELHSPLFSGHPEVIELREAFERVGSPWIGFIPDFSATMNAVPEGYWRVLRGLGGSEELIDAAKEIWKTNRPNPEKFGALSETAARLGTNPAASARLNQVMTMFAHHPVESWSELLPYARHIHGKFYEVRDGVETSIPYPQIMALLKKEGYSGTISAEWEGHAFTEDAIGLQQVQAWHAMCRRLLAN